MAAVVMPAWLKRLEQSRHAKSFLLRGGLLLNHWLPVERPVEDLDLLSLVPLKQAEQAVREIDAVKSVETIWAETKWPGLRFQLDEFQLDVGFGDPLVAGPVRVKIPPARVLAVRPEIMYGWKAHGLFERGIGRWRAKDLWDLHLMQTHLKLRKRLLRKAVAMAFSSRNMSLDLNDRFFRDEWGTSKGSLRKWEQLRERTDVPVDLPDARRAVADFLLIVVDR